MYKKKYLANAIALAMLAQGGIALAAEEQTDATDDVEVIQVQGIRGSLNKALSIKRTEVQIVDAIVAEDIGKFPDNNVVEALQRVTGVQTTGRGGGEVSTISIRGLNDVNTTVNGRPIFTGAGRFVSLQDIPASLLSGVKVFKTRSASQIEVGIAGSLDIETQRPFNFEDATIVVAGRGIYQDQSEKTDPNVSILASNRWDLGDFGEFGALVNVSYAETNYRDDSLTAGAVYPHTTLNPPEGYGSLAPIPNTEGDDSIWQAGTELGLPFNEGSTLVYGGGENEYWLGRDAVFGTTYEGLRERPAANISLQWAPTDTLEFVAEAFYNGYRNHSQTTMWFATVYPTSDGLEAMPEFIEGTNVMASRQAIAPSGFQSGDAARGETDTYLYALGSTWNPTDDLKLKAEVVYQESDYSGDFFAMRFERVAYGADVTFTDGNSGMPGIEFWDDPDTVDLDESDMTDIDNWNASTMWDNGGGNSGDALSFTLDGEYFIDGDFLEKVKFGARRDVRNTTANERGQDATYSGTLRQLMADLEANGAEDATQLAYLTTDYMQGRANIFDSFIAANGYYMLDNADAVRAAYGISAEELWTSFDIEETGTAFYLTTNFFLTDDISGELGVRYVKYEQDMQFWADGFDADGNRLTEYGNNETSEVLPSLVVNWNVIDDVVARASYTETLRMPEFTQLNAYITYQDPLTDIPYGTGGGGNPDLQPTTSKNFDLSVEWYFAEASSLYGAVFKREIEGLVIDGRKTVTRKGDDGITRPYVVSSPVNAADGELSGLELGLIYFPEQMPDLLDGLGFQASFTALDSSQKTPDFAEDGSISQWVDSKMSGVSDTSFSTVVMYDKDNVNMRLSYVWREAFYTGNEAAIFANPIQFWSRPERDLSFSLGYDVTENLTISADATNLLDDKYQNYYGEGNQDIFNFGTGLYSRTFSVGFRYKM